MDQDRADELFAAFGPVRVKRMFGGFGVHAEGVMFALETKAGALHLKSDSSTDAAFEAEGCEPFSFPRGARTITTSYRRAPERLLDDPDEMAVWARRALAVALASRSARKPRRRPVD